MIWKRRKCYQNGWNIYVYILTQTISEEGNFRIFMGRNFVYPQKKTKKKANSNNFP